MIFFDHDAFYSINKMLYVNNIYIYNSNILSTVQFKEAIEAI